MDQHSQHSVLRGVYLSLHKHVNLAKLFVSVYCEFSYKLVLTVNLAKMFVRQWTFAMPLQILTWPNVPT